MSKRNKIVALVVLLLILIMCTSCGETPTPPNKEQLEAFLSEQSEPRLQELREKYDADDLQMIIKVTKISSTHDPIYEKRGNIFSEPVYDRRGSVFFDCKAMFYSDALTQRFEENNFTRDELEAVSDDFDFDFSPEDVFCNEYEVHGFFGMGCLPIFFDSEGQKYEYKFLRGGDAIAKDGRIVCAAKESRLLEAGDLVSEHMDSTPTSKCVQNNCFNMAVGSGDSVYCVEHSATCKECGCYIDKDATYCFDCMFSALN